MKSLLFRTIFAGLMAASMLGAASAYTFFQDNFENAPDAGPDSADPLLGNGMRVGANVFNASNSYLYQYFSFPAPNVTGDNARFCNVATGQGGPDQGNKVLAVFNDYNNSAAHTAGDLVDANLYVEYTLEEADLGTTVTFQFDAKMGDFDATPLVFGGSDPFTPEAQAFVKVLDPLNGYSTSTEDPVDATTFGTLWNTYFLTITIPNDNSWVGRILQAGFRTKTSQFQASGIFYDNLFLTSDRVDLGPQPIKIVSLVKSGSNFTITWESEEGVVYDVEKAFDLENDIWDFVGDQVTGDASGTSSQTDEFATDPSATYRVVIAP